MGQCFEQHYLGYFAMSAKRGLIQDLTEQID